eukprot:TRINITY_DN8173_c0_g1_i3.p1 TRINITY_DN8173_c0_g1~~TRINITY_DN8173_c0_g1_i3.p1  ORF type:complete len:756 (+),score=128.05 TRINITY_DN8173_c0_g1_i3:101-2368(+)
MDDGSDEQTLLSAVDTPVARYGTSATESSGASTPHEATDAPETWEEKVAWELAGTFQAASQHRQACAALYQPAAGAPGASRWHGSSTCGVAALAYGPQSDAKLAEQRRQRRKLTIGLVIVLSVLVVIHRYFRPGTPWRALLALGTLMMDVVLVWVEFPSDAVFLFSTAFLTVTGCVSSTSALVGFSNEGVMTIGPLLALAKAFYDSGAVTKAMPRVLGMPRGSRRALLRVVLSAVLLSAFFFDVPVVAILIPELRMWADGSGMGIGKLLMPLSFATMLGGCLTLLGSSVSIVAASQAVRVTGGPAAVPVFSLLPVGAALAAAGMLYLIAAEPLLPVGSREPTAEANEPATPSSPQGLRRSYMVHFRVSRDSPLVGLSAASGGVTRVAGVIRIARVEDQAADLAVEGVDACDATLQADSVLVIEVLAVGVVGLRRIRGISLVPQPGVPANRQGDTQSWARRRRRVLVEAVLGPGCAWNRGKPYEGAEPLAISGGKRRCSAGDCVLVECFPQFATAYSVLCSHFLLILPVPDVKPPRADHARIQIVLAIAGTVVVLATLSPYPLLYVSIGAALALLLTQSISLADAWAVVDGRALVTIAAAFGVSNALDHSGAAALVAELLYRIAAALGGSQLAVLSVLYLAVVLAAFALSPGAVAVLMMPIVFAVKALGDPLSAPLPYALLVIYAASATYAAPFACTANLMVWRPGGYTTAHFVKVGFGLQVVTATVTVLGCWLLLGEHFGADGAVSNTARHLSAQ